MKRKKKKPGERVFEEKKINFLNAQNKETGNHLVNEEETEKERMREVDKESIESKEWSDHLSYFEEEKSLMYPQVTATKCPSVIGNTFTQVERKFD